jgi:hypothetical protein|tara:strand:- start:212 stop:493 length:282 start_codon:yes stop_codon:yes gene_type:complete
MTITSELEVLETREQFLDEAARLRTLAIAKHQVASVGRGTYNRYTKSKAPSKYDVAAALQSDLDFLNEMCMQANQGSIFAEKEPVVVRTLANR